MRIQTIAEQLLYVTVRLETQGTDPHKLGVGTSFIFGLKREKGTFLCLVTNKHVIQGARIGRFFFTQRKGDGPDMGKRLNIEMDSFETRWFGHPDPEIDITAMPLVPIIEEIKKKYGKEIFFKQLNQSLIPNAEQIEEFDALEDIVFVSYPSGIYDTINLLPVFRRGITATPIQIDYTGKPIFLIDASIFPGSSGSPVFVYKTSGYTDRKGAFVIRSGPRLFLAGIVSQVVIREETGTLEFVSIPTAKVPIIKTQQIIDLGVVFKASAIVETIEDLFSLLERPRSQE